MRTFEIFLLLVVTVLPFVKRPLLDRVKAKSVLIFLGALLALHLIFEGWRWQMIPAYVMTLILAWRIHGVDSEKPVRLTFLRVTGFAGIVVLAFLGWVLPMALPVFSLPEPTGSYSVGTEIKIQGSISPLREQMFNEAKTEN